MTEWAPRLALAALLIAVGVFRAPILSDDRTWPDEVAVLLDGRGIFKGGTGVLRTEVYHREPSVANVLTVVRVGAYPPGMALLAFSLSNAENPMRQMRRVMFGLGLLLLGLVFAVANHARGRMFALLATTYVASSMLLTHSSQSIKWNAVAPVLASLASALVLLPTKPDTTRIQWGHVLTLAALLHVHYFCVWVVPAHLAYSWLFERDRWRRRVGELLLAIGMATPWYITALPQQWAFAEAHMQAVSVPGTATFEPPLTIAVGARALSYDVLVFLGLFPSPWRALYALPLAFLGWYLLWRALRATEERTRRLAGLATCCICAAMAGQALYAAASGTVLPLAAYYFTPWVPLLMTAVLAGCCELSSRWARLGSCGILLGLSLSSVLSNPLIDYIANSTMPRDYGVLCPNLERQGGGSTAFLHDSIALAEGVNVACRLEGWQAAGADAWRDVPKVSRRLVTVSACGAPPIVSDSRWLPASSECVANAQVSVYERE